MAKSYARFAIKNMVEHLLGNYQSDSITDSIIEGLLMKKRKYKNNIIQFPKKKDIPEDIIDNAILKASKGSQIEEAVKECLSNEEAMNLFENKKKCLDCGEVKDMKEFLSGCGNLYTPDCINCRGDNR